MVQVPLGITLSRLEERLPGAVSPETSTGPPAMGKRLVLWDLDVLRKLLRTFPKDILVMTGLTMIREEW